MSAPLRAPRAFRIACRLLPPRFRDRHAADCEADVASMLDESGAPPGRLVRAAIWTRAVLDIVLVAPSLHLRERRRLARTSPHDERLSHPSSAMPALTQDLRYAWRAVRRHPAPALIAVITLALGIGAATTMFTVVNGVLLRPLPYREPERLVNIWNYFGENAQSLPAVSAADWKDYQRLGTLFEDFAAATGANEIGASGIVTSEGSDPERVSVNGISANFLPLLGTVPMLGRQFVAEDEVVGGPNVVMLTHGIWQRRYGGDSSIVGKPIEFDGVPHTVIGILPPTFRLLLAAEAYAIRSDAELYKPLRFDWQHPAPRNLTLFTVYGRMKPGVTLAQAQAQLNAIAARLRAEHPVHADANLRIRAFQLHQDVVKGVRSELLLLLGAVGLLVLIACANVANLLLARASQREREISIRLAVGASRWRLVQQLLAESAVLAVLAGALGVAVAFGGLAFLDWVQPASLPRVSDVRIDWTVMAFVSALLLVVSLLCGIAPGLHGARQGVGGILKGGGRVANQGRQPLMRNALIVGEVALSVVLLVAAGLFVRSFLHLQEVRPGFVGDGALSFHIALPRSSYKNFDARRAFSADLSERLRAIPGVTSVGASSILPLTGQAPLQPYAYDAATASKWESLTADMVFVTSDYFSAAGTRLLAGRSFAASDDNAAPRVVVVDEMIARRAWPNESAIGKRLQLQPEGDSTSFATVVGVAEHVRSNSLDAEGLPQIYFSYYARTVGNLNWIVRSSLPPEQLGASVRRVVAEMNPSLPVSNVAPLATYVEQGLAQARFTLVLMQIVGGLAVFLAAVGLYGVIAFVVGQRTREFGIRVALGETPAGLRRWVVLRGMRLVAASAAIGVVAALLAMGAVQGMLYEVSPYDPVTFGAVLVFLLGVAAAACWVPARRASRADPLEALRAE